MPGHYPSREDKEVIFRRDAYACSICGRTMREDAKDLEIDHKVPLARGGRKDRLNLQTVCTACAAIKQRACEGCDFGCYQCPYAFPETGLDHILLRWLPGAPYDVLVEMAREKDCSPHDIIAKVVDDYFERKRKLIVGITGTAFL